MYSLGEAGLAEMRALIFELRPDALAIEGLMPALERQTASLRSRHNLQVDMMQGRAAGNFNHRAGCVANRPGFSIRTSATREEPFWDHLDVYKQL